MNNKCNEKLEINSTGYINFPSKCKSVGNLVLELPEDISLSDITKVSIIINGTYFDTIFGIENLEILCLTLNRELDITSKYFPLVCCPFYENNIVPVPHSMVLKVEYKFGNKDIFPSNLKAYADLYFLEEIFEESYSKEKITTNFTDLLTCQSQQYECSIIKNVINQQYVLNFNHPGQCIALYGLDKNRISNVKLMQNGDIVQFTQLEHPKFYILRLDSHPNFSNGCRVVFDYDGSNHCNDGSNNNSDTLKILGINYNVVRFSDLGIGMAYCM